MSNKIKYLFLVFCIFLIAGSPSAKNYLYSSKIILKIKEDGDNNYKFIYDTEISKRFTVKKELIPPVEILYDDPFTEISKVVAYRNKERIGKDYIDKVSLKDRNEFFTEDKSYAIRISSEFEKGDILKYTYRNEYKNYPYPNLFLIPNADSILSYEIEIYHPEYMTVDYDYIKLSKDIEINVTKNEVSQTNITVTPLAGFDELEYFKGNDNLGFILLKYNDPWQDSTESYFSPKGFVDWYKTLTDLEPKFNNFNDSALLKEILAQPTDFDKIRCISKYVQDHFRYIAIGRENHSITPFAPEFILNNKYGDCKDRAALVSSLARLVGLDVYMTLVPSSTLIDLKSLNSALFNHVICCYINDSDTLFFDPTVKYTHFPRLPENIVDYEVIVLKEDPFIARLDTPIDPYMMSLTLNGSIDSLKNINAQFKLRNFFYTDYFYNANTNDFKLQEYLNNFLSVQFHKIKFSDFKVEDSDDYELTISAVADLSGMVVSSPTKRYIPKTQIAVYDKLLMEREEDPFPLNFIARKKFILELNLSNSADSLMPDSLVIDRGEYGYYRSDIYKENDSIKVKSLYIRPLKNIDTDNKQKHFDFCQDYNNEKNNLFIINKVRE